ncbi:MULTISPECIES: YhcB family protein [Ferrimonas]|uniref:YhcB family protein n=1 Tax=Ferrimonas TaxID=44011 RepID=UPI00042623DC|nr:MULTISPECIES: DUF1043 family protein [Ferrimonas]USD37226.1 DUF1043 family protein [Ferrimonas sp. SCSIO 43195]
MNEVWIVLALIVGFGLGYAVRWRTSGTPADAHSVRQKLEKARFELDQQRQEMADYFEQSHATLLQLSQDVDKANRLWNESASHLFEEQLSTAKLPLHQPEPEPLTTEDQQPNDYVHGSHGIISPRKKVS